MDANTAMFHSDVIGSLLRPAYLKEARAARERGELSDAAFKRIEDRAVNEAIDVQTAAGLDVITDGEMRRYAFYGHLIDCVDGFDKLGGWAIPFRDEKGEKVLLQRPAETPAPPLCRRIRLSARPHPPSGQGDAH
jgi:5-methyltetrahydropteroyltriglutamate--homocysteine methyltransferase